MNKKKKKILEDISNNLIFEKKDYEKIRDINSFRDEIKKKLEKIGDQIAELLEKKSIIRGFLTYWSIYHNKMLLTLPIMEKCVRPRYEKWDKFYGDLKIKLGGELLFRIPKKPVYVFERQKPSKKSINTLINLKEGWKCLGKIPEENALGKWKNNVKKYIRSISKQEDNAELREQLQNSDPNGTQKEFAKKLVNEIIEILKTKEEDFSQIKDNLGIRNDEEVYKDIIKSLLVYFASMPKWRYLCYIPAQVSEERPSGGLALFSKKEIPEEDVIFLRAVINRIFGLSVSLEFEKLQEQHALRSAVAAIMARNMSHNIGSHVLNYLSDTDEVDKEIEVLI